MCRQRSEKQKCSRSSPRQCVSFFRPILHCLPVPLLFKGMCLRVVAIQQLLVEGYVKQGLSIKGATCTFSQLTLIRPPPLPPSPPTKHLTPPITQAAQCLGMQHTTAGLTLRRVALAWPCVTLATSSVMESSLVSDWPPTQQTPENRTHRLRVSRDWQPCPPKGRCSRATSCTASNASCRCTLCTSVQDMPQ